MNTLPAKEFLDRFITAYGETWEELFDSLTEHPPCAKHLAEMIDDIERYGQQNPIFVDKDGMVSDGHTVAVALTILGEEVKFVMADAPDPEPEQLWEVEFEVDDSDFADAFDHLQDYLSFRVEGDWVQPLTAMSQDGEVTIVMFCPGGEYTADRMLPEISERLQRLAGVSVSGAYVSQLVLDEDPAE